MSRLKARLKALGALAAGAVLVFGTAACSSGASEEPGANTGAPDAGTELQEVQFANFGWNPSTAYLAWAQEGGYYEAQGLSVTESVIGSSADMINTLFSGDSDFVFTGQSVIVSAVNVGRPAAIIAGPTRPYQIEVAFTPEVDAELRAQGFSPNSPIAERVAALKGLTIVGAPSGSTSDSVFRMVLENQGFNPDTDFTQMFVDGTTEALFAALRSGDVDGMVSVLGGPTTFAEAEGLGVVWSFADGDPSIEALPQAVLGTSQQVIDEKPEIVQAFLQALFDARAAIVEGLSDKDAARLKELVAPDMDQAVYDDTMETFRTRAWIHPFTFSDDAWDATLHITTMASDSPIDVSQDAAVNNSFAESLE